jgi:hypothetical protein
MRFQQRDGLILQEIYRNDGVVAKRHLKILFWSDKSWRAMEQRLSKLHKQGYLVWPSRDQYKFFPIPEPICWLGWKGAIYLAGVRGVVVEPPKSETETQLRVFQKNLRKKGVRWVREPRWSLLRHDLAIIDFRLSMERSVGQISSLILENWQPESVFRTDVDKVIFTARTRTGGIVHLEKGVCPDAYFEIVDESLRMVGKPHKMRILLEMDMSTHDNPSFGREKAAAGFAYIRSAAYKARFGNNNGCWLIVTGGGKRRLKNLMKQTKDQLGSDSSIFYFISLENANTDNLLNTPIWWQSGMDTPVALLE